MITAFITTFFIAELIIALAVISKIRQFNSCVNNWNASISVNKNRIGVAMTDFRMGLEGFSRTILKIKELIRKKRQDYLIKIIKTILIYGSFFTLKGKYKKTLLACQFIKEVYDGFQEA